MAHDPELIPKHRTRWNWNYDLPFGRGRAFARNAPQALNGLIGGWKLSGSGTLPRNHDSHVKGRLFAPGLVLQ